MRTFSIPGLRKQDAKGSLIISSFLYLRWPLYRVLGPFMIASRLFRSHLRCQSNPCRPLTSGAPDYPARPERRRPAPRPGRTRRTASSAAPHPKSFSSDSIILMINNEGLYEVSLYPDHTGFAGALGLLSTGIGYAYWRRSDRCPDSELGARSG